MADKKKMVLRHSTHLAGQVDADIVVESGINVQLHGIVTGNVLLREGSELVIHGRVDGSVTNLGGVLVIFGNVVGTIKGPVTAR
jgi:cytoskeletal protein CcmA (bactofilin family)